MEILWNKRNLQHPPFESWEAPVRKYDPKSFLKVVDEILTGFKSFSILNKEAALLSRLIYRMKSKFRHDKGFKFMEKVNRALLNYLNMSLEKEFELLKKYTVLNHGITSLPSKQTMEYILVRIQGLGKIMARVESTAMQAGNILKTRIQLGQYWSVALIAYSVIGRIWILSRYIIRKLNLWYNNIYNCTKTFKIIGIPWLPETYILPKNLSNWLDLPWLNENKEIIPIKADWKKSIFNLMEVDNIVEPNFSVIDDSLSETSNKEVQAPNICQNELISQKNDDLGKPISRTNFEKSICVSNKKIQITKNENKKLQKFVNIKSEKDLIALLKTDSFSGIDKLQWNITKKRLKRFLSKSVKNDANVDEQLFKEAAQKLNKWLSLL